MPAFAGMTANTKVDDCTLFVYKRAMADKLDVLRKHCADVGRDFDTIVKTLQIELPPPTDAPSARQMADQLREFVDLGVTHLMLDLGVVTDPAVVRRIGEDVLARFK